MVSFTPQLLYPPKRNPQYPMDRTLSGPQRWSGCSGEEKNLCQESNPGHPAHSLTNLKI